MNERMLTFYPCSFIKRDTKLCIPDKMITWHGQFGGCGCGGIKRLSLRAYDFRTPFYLLSTPLWWAHLFQLEWDVLFVSIFLPLHYSNLHALLLQSIRLLPKIADRIVPPLPRKKLHRESCKYKEKSPCNNQEKHCTQTHKKNKNKNNQEKLVWMGF